MKKLKNNKQTYVNYHAHIPMMFWIGKGASGDWHETWWKPYIEPIEKTLTKKDMVILSEACALAFLKNNITEVWDMYFFEEEVAKSVSKYGIKIHAGEVIMKDPPTGYKDYKDAIAATERLIKKFKDNPLIEPVVGYIGPYHWASDKELTKQCAELAIKYKRPIHTHGAGSESDVEGCKKLYNMLPIETMEHFRFFSEEIPEVVVAHCAILYPEEIEILKKYKDKAKIAVCPSTIDKLNYHKAPVKQLIKNGIQVVLGTDGASPCGMPNIKKEIEIAVKQYGVNKKYFEEANKSKIKAKNINTKEQERIIKEWKACLESIIKRINLKEI